MIRINDSKSKTTMKAAVLMSVFLLFAVATGFGQQVINLTAGPATTTLPDGTTLPMWGYSCGTAVTTSTATCAPLTGSTSGAATGALGGIYVINGGSGYTSAPTVTITPAAGNTPTTPAVATAVVSGGAVVGFNVTNHGAGYTAAPTVALTLGGGAGAVAASGLAWSPVKITVPYGATGGLQIALTNNLLFPTSGTANSIPTSIVIIGQVGGGLGGAPTTTASPSHALAQGCPSWFIAAQPPGTACTTPTAGASGTPPLQAPRIQSMGTEVAPVAPGTVSSTSLTWANLRPGTYLLESGTHPSIQVPMGLIGMLVVTTPPTSGTVAGTAYPAVAATTRAAIPAVTYSAEVPLEFSEIDPVQNKAVDQAVRTAGFSETRVWSGLPTDPQGNPGCGNPSSTTYHQCYPPAVNYTAFYFLINGLAFDKANPAPSLFAATAGGTPAAPITTGITPTGTVLVRLVNAGLHMHVPAIVGSQTTGFTGAGVLTTTANPVTGFTLIAEDGNPVPDLTTPTGTTITAPRVKSEVFMAAGKTFDVMVNVPTTATSLPVFDRSLALSANSSVRDAGMLAYIGVNGSLLPVGTGVGPFVAATANPDSYPAVIPCALTAPTCTALAVSDPSKGVIANDINVYGVALSSAPTQGTLTCNAIPGNPVNGICANGTFTYTPLQGWSGSDTFGYCANGAVAGTTGMCTTVTLAASTLAGNPVANAITYMSKMATFIKIPSPGILSVDSDPSNLPLSVVLTAPLAPTLAGGTLNVDPNGGFTASVSGTGTTACPTGAPTGSNCYSFNYRAENSQGRASAPATVTLVFPPPSNLQVHVLDAQAYNNCNLNTACIAKLTPFPDYRWIIEEDKTFWVNPNCTTNSSISTPGCATIVGGTSAASPSGSTIPAFGTNFHTSTMDFVAQGCTGPLSCEGGQTFLNPATGTHVNAVCDVGNGACRPDTTGHGFTAVNPSQVYLNPAKRYYISVLPGDAANPFPANVSGPACNGVEAAAGNTACGHTMSGAPIPPACNILGGANACTTTSAFTQVVNVLTLPTPLPTGKLSVIVFEDDFPLNGEQDGGGGNGTVAPIEPGLGGFNLVLWDTYGGLGDVTGQDTYDAFNQPLSNSLSGSIDPTTGLDACPVSANATSAPSNGLPAASAPPTGGVTGMIVTCPKYESDGHTLSPLAGQAVIDHLMPDKFSVQAYPAADRIARGEQWVQTNTLDGQHPHDAFIEISDPSYFQEYGPAGYHVAIGFANPAIINARHTDVCAGNGTPGSVGPCTNTITGQVDAERLSRTPDQRLYPSGSRDALAWTQCWVSLGDPDGEDFMFTFCDANGNFSFANVPGGEWRLTIGDQWNDQIIDGLSTPVNVGCSAPNVSLSTCKGGQTVNVGNIGTQQWQANLYTRTFIDANKDGIWESNEIGIPFIYTMIHYRDGHNANALSTDFNGVANFNEAYPLFNWYVVEADSTRYKTTGVHTVYDAGGPADGTTYCGPSNGARACGSSTAYSYLTNSYEAVPLPADLSFPGAVYCTKADCTAEATSFVAGTAIPSSSTASTGRIDPPFLYGGMEGFAGLTGLNNWMDIGKAPYAACNSAISPTATGNYCATVTTTAPGATTPTTTYVGENGGIYGQVAYASTRPFDDASQMIQQPWEPNVPNVTLNLYQEGFASDGVTPTLTLVDTTQSSSWDNWAQGFYPNYTDPTTGLPLPQMNCPGQGTNAAGAPNQDLFFFTLYDQPFYLDWYNSMLNGGALHTLPYSSQYKCYDSMHIGNQMQPAPYDGKYSFPSSLGINPASTAATKLVATKGSTNGVTASMNGTNCTICVPNPDSTDKYRYGAPMLPPGKYVVEVIMPPGYEVYKEEDKNLLIGDNFIAPATQEFAGLGADIFILPDQASVASMYDETGSGYNGTNYQDSTTGLGLADELSGVPGFPGYTDPVWPCVGEMRVVPDYLSLFPQAQETAPFAGATRPLCDRKEVLLQNQLSANVRFFVFTSTHIASKFAGGITDDATSEFDPFSPQFGEKFAPPNLPVSTRDYLGNELSRVYSDHWGTYDGLTFSSWEVNPPNITGYSPSMMTQCMNDPGPTLDTNSSSPTYGQMITDPLYNPAYSDFCYINPFMPGLTTYNDTPVVPTQAFVGAGYNNVDCSYPDATPGIKEVDGTGVGPWVSAAGGTLTITAIGDTQVNNSAYSGPSANTAPFNAKTVGRHYGFGATQGTGSVTIGGVTATVTGWSDTSITVTVPATGTAKGQIPPCAVQQQKQYGGSTAYCGQLVITAGNGKQSIDTVTVTIGGKAPTHVGANASIQSAINAAAPGDLLVVDPTCSTTGTTPLAAACSASALDAATPTQTASVASHNEMLLMWKPVRLQGVGAVSSIINASAFPAGKLLDPWRRHINCLFGLTLNGVPSQGNGTGAAAVPYDPTGTYSCPDAGWNYYTTPGTLNVPQIDRLPLEAVTGWDAIVNGNIAEQLQEPSLMGAYEGAGITVLGKGVWVSASDNTWTDGSEPGGFPPDALLLQDVPVNPDDEGAALGPQVSYCFTIGSNGASTTTELAPNPYPSNYECNPSSIDGLTVTGSSQGGGGVLVHGWAHNLQIANNRVTNNAGTLAGGITVGQGEFPIALTVVDQEGSSGATAPIGEFVPDNPPSCLWVPIIGTHLPYCLDVHVNMHNNYITGNSSLGDELFSGTLAGGAGASICTGSDYYKFQYNWVCGNVSSAEGGGISHIGFVYDGDIEHNSILLNQSTNPTIPTNGGGIVVMGTPDTDPICGTALDADCPPGLSDGTGPGLVINANLIEANMAESGSGGGIRMQQVNGTEISLFPNGCTVANAGALATCPRSGGTPAYDSWNGVSITNNMIVNNLAGWDGAGISLQDSLNVSIVNNTIASNDSLASSGVLTQSLGTPEASAPAGSCVQAGGTTSCPQSAGVTSTQNSSILTTTFTGLTITCPTGMPGCTGFSNPLLQNNVIWQNRSFDIGVGNLGGGNLGQQNLVSLFNASGTAAPVQTALGQCTTGVSYWDIGVRGDTGPTNHGSGFTLAPTYSIITSTTGYPTSNTATVPGFMAQYCNGTRVPPTCTVADGCGGPSGYGVPPGIVDASSPNPVFSLTPSATVDEGNNWINVSWGPLALSDDSVAGGANGNYGGGALFANYSPSASFDGTAAAIPVSQPHPTTDFFGNPRPETGDTTSFDPGAVEFQGAAGTATLSVTGGPLTFSSSVGVTSAAQTLTLHNTGTAGATGIGLTFSTTVFTRPGGTCTATLAAGATCTITVAFTPTSATTVTGTLTIAANVAVTGSPVGLTGTGVASTRTWTVSPTSLTFANEIPGTTSASQTLTITNTGTVAILGTAASGATATFGGGTPADFARAAGTAARGTCGNGADFALAVGASCTYNVVFSPTAAATSISRTLTFAATGFPNLSVPLSGASTAVTVAFSAPVPSLVTGTTTAHSGTVTVTNNSGAAITPATIAVNKVGGAGGAFTHTGGTCVVGTAVASGGTCTVIVTYTPGTAGTTTGTAHVTLTDTLAGATGTATQTSANFTAN